MGNGAFVLRLLFENFSFVVLQSHICDSALQFCVLALVLGTFRDSASILQNHKVVLLLFWFAFRARWAFGTCVSTITNDVLSLLWCGLSCFYRITNECVI